jgi:hypothetical protein
VAADNGFTVGVDEHHIDVDIRVRWREGFDPNQLIALFAKACGEAAQQITDRLEGCFDEPV